METKEEIHEKMLRYFADDQDELERYMKFYDYYGFSNSEDKLFVKTYGKIYNEISNKDINVTEPELSINKKPKISSAKLNVKDENKLRVIANIILSIGCIFVIIAFCIAIWMLNQYFQDPDLSELAYIYVLISFIVLFFAIGFWALLRVISNMSVSLKILVHFSK